MSEQSAAGKVIDLPVAFHGQFEEPQDVPLEVAAAKESPQELVDLLRQASGDVEGTDKYKAYQGVLVKYNADIREMAGDLLTSEEALRKAGVTGANILYGMAEKYQGTSPDVINATRGTAEWKAVPRLAVLTAGYKDTTNAYKNAIGRLRGHVFATLTAWKQFDETLAEAGQERHFPLLQAWNPTPGQPKTQAEADARNANRFQISTSKPVKAMENLNGAVDKMLSNFNVLPPTEDEAQGVLEHLDSTVACLLKIRAVCVEVAGEPSVTKSSKTVQGLNEALKAMLEKTA